MTRTSVHDYADALRVRYAAAGRPERSRLLDEFCQTTGYHRKAAVGGGGGGGAPPPPTVVGAGRRSTGQRSSRRWSRFGSPAISSAASGSPPFSPN